MSARRHEEILEECLSAYLEGRRSIEESLSLYPAYAAELGPLLQAATRFGEALGSQAPSVHVRDRGLRRFLSDARARRSLAALRFDDKPRGLTAVWHQYRYGLVTAGVALLVVAISITGTALIGDRGPQETGPEAQELPPTPAAVRDFQAALERLKDRGPHAQRADLLWLRVAVEDLQALPPEEVVPLLDSLTQQLAEAEEVVSSIASGNPDVADEAAEAGEAIRTVTGALTSPTPVGAGSDDAETPRATPDATAGPADTPPTTEQATIPPATVPATPPSTQSAP